MTPPLARKEKKVKNAAGNAHFRRNMEVHIMGVENNDIRVLYKKLYSG